MNIYMYLIYLYSLMYIYNICVHVIYRYSYAYTCTYIYECQQVYFSPLYLLRWFCFYIIQRSCQLLFEPAEMEGHLVWIFFVLPWVICVTLSVMQIWGK